jgi:hypothetical protein
MRKNPVFLVTTIIAHCAQKAQNAMYVNLSFTLITPQVLFDKFQAITRLHACLVPLKIVQHASMVHIARPASMSITLICQ